MVLPLMVLPPNGFTLSLSPNVVFGEAFGQALSPSFFEGILFEAQPKTRKLFLFQLSGNLYILTLVAVKFAGNIGEKIHIEINMKVYRRCF